MTGRIWTSSKQSHGSRSSRTKRKDELLGWTGQWCRKLRRDRDIQSCKLSFWPNCTSISWSLRFIVHSETSGRSVPIKECQCIALNRNEFDTESLLTARHSVTVVNTSHLCGQTSRHLLVRISCPPCWISAKSVVYRADYVFTLVCLQSYCYDPMNFYEIC